MNQIEGINISEKALIPQMMAMVIIIEFSFSIVFAITPAAPRDRFDVEGALGQVEKRNIIPFILNLNMEKSVVISFDSSNSDRVNVLLANFRTSLAYMILNKHEHRFIKLEINKFIKTDMYIIIGENFNQIKYHLLEFQIFNSWNPNANFKISK